MRFDNQEPQHPAPPGWPYGIPFDPKYVYLPYSKSGMPPEFPAIIPAEPPGYFPVSTDTSVDSLLAQRGELIDSRMEMILSDIDQRRSIKDKNFYQILVDQCSCKNLIFDREDIKVPDRLRIEQKIIDLEENKRREEVSYFRDIMFLKRDLRYALIEKMEEEQKCSFFFDKTEV